MVHKGSMLAALLLAACSNQPIALTYPITAINGEVPPGKLERLHNTSVMIDTITADGKRLLVQRGTRRAGTRVGIHAYRTYKPPFG